MRNQAQSLTVIALMVALTGLAGCGQKGPLYLPEDVPEQVPQQPAEQEQNDAAASSQSPR